MRASLLVLVVLVIFTGCLAKPERRNIPQQQSSQVERVQQHAPRTQQQHRPRNTNVRINNNSDEGDSDERKSGAHVIPSFDSKMVERVLRDEDKTSDMVDCVLYFRDGCPKQLERVHRIAPEIFRRGGRCFKCSSEERGKLRRFLVMLQRKQPKQYRRMISELNQL